jgi:hypothetical protein
MKVFVGRHVAWRLGAVALLTCVCAEHARAQDPNLKATYGSVTLKAGFTPDPYARKLEAGGPVQTNRGGLTAWVAKAPDFQVYYTAGSFALTFHVQADADTTLLINTPNGEWVANDDGPNNGLNPLLRFASPLSGRYDIWVGTLSQGGTPPATLFVTEVK